MKDDFTHTATKPAYEKPMLRVIELTADEVLAIGCKTATSGAAPVKPPPCMAHRCVKAGS